MPTRGGRLGGVLRARPAGPAGPARTPFVLLVVVLLAGGLITLLLLNSALNEGSFHLSKLKKETTALTDEQQALQRDVDAYSAPDALERRARELGLVPGGGPVFLRPDGKVDGVASTASAPPPVPAEPAAAGPAAPPHAADPAVAGSPAPTASAPAASGSARPAPVPSAPAAPTGPSAAPDAKPTPNPGR
ncbi:cell division protein FtsL [Streptomyces sp. NPDC097619]|uniref:FtsB family cell division protein n=1 Tax=Streptomyces sp. NPDC097619 TaxID=3157228 RepID=UPI00332CCA3A